MTDEPEIKVVRMPVLDTGIGREAGFADDAALIAAHEAERAALSPEERELLDRVDAELVRHFVEGSP